MRRVVIGMVTTALALTSLVATTAPATAATRYTDPPGTTVTTPLFADCSRMTAGGREYARRHGIPVCGANTTPQGTALRTEAVGGEECGSLTLVATSWGGGIAAVGWTTASETGPVVRVDLELSVAGTTGTTLHRFTGPPAPSTRAGVVGYVGAGLAVVTLSGTIQTATSTCALSSAPARFAVR